MGAHPGRRRPGGRRRRLVALVAVPAAILGGAVAYSMNADRSAAQLGNEVTCFQGPSLDLPAAGAVFSGQDLASFCDTQWSSGSIQAPPPGPAPASWVACEGADRGVDVFPSDDQDLCGRLGLEPVPPDYYDAVRRYSAMEADLWGRFTESGCPAAAEARATAREVLDAHGYSSWTVDTVGFGEVTPCAGTPDLDPVNGVATIRGRVVPELLAAVRRGLDGAGWCGPASALVGGVQDSLRAAGFADWTAGIDHRLTERWPCVAGFSEEPAAKRIVLQGYASR